jgi:hypothetical protein
MDIIHTPFGVFIILGIVTVAAASYEPSGYLGNWRRLADRYKTNRPLARILFKGQHIFVGRLMGGPRFFADNIGEYARFDVDIGKEGLWLHYGGPMPKKAPDQMLIPWPCIEFRKKSDATYYFDVAADDPVEISVTGELALAIRRRVEVLPDNAFH